MSGRVDVKCSVWALAAVAGLAIGQLASSAAAQPETEPVPDEAEAIEVESLDAPSVDLPNPPSAEGDDSLVSFSVFSDPVTLPSLIQFVAETLEINITTKGAPDGSVVFNTALEVPKSELLSLLDAMLEQYNFGVTFDDTSGFYVVTPEAELPRTFDGAFATTRIIETPNVRPSTLQAAVQAVLPGTQGGVTFVDELGVMIVTARPRQISRVESLVADLLERNAQLKFWPIQLSFVAAPTARDRAIALAGAQSGGTSRLGAAAATAAARRAQAGQEAGGIAATAGGTLDNLAERLSIDPQGNTLIFRGTEEELDNVLPLIELVDRPSELEPQRYFVGGAARQIADIAQQQGFGQVVTLDATGAGGVNNLQVGNRNVNQLQGLGTADTAGTGGPLMVVDVANGSIIYYGTPAQQEDLAGLVEELDIESDRVVIRTYRLNHADAEELGEVLNALIAGTSQTGQSSFLPQGQQGPQAQQAAERARELAAQIRGEDGGEGEIGDFDPTLVSVIPDAANNQIVIKAPRRQQDDFRELIERLDLRRPQVFVEAMIVSISDDRDFQLAVESQIVAGQFAIQSSFGLTGSGDSILAPRVPATGLAGVTSAVVKTDFVPFIVNALQTDTDATIRSTPSLLVNDNQEAEIVSLDEEPTTELTTGQTTDTVSFSGFQEAGTTLRVTPSISDAGFLRLEYFVELSAFTGAGGNGIPPPRQTNTVQGQVSIPSDATIVVGGIRNATKTRTVSKFPILGDIPIIGNLFRDTNEEEGDAVLYVCITPRIMSDPDFRDIKLFTRGPQAETNVDFDIPPLEPLRIDVIRPTSVN